MRTLYLDCGMGAAGDMLTAALLELLPEPDKFIKEINNLGIPGVCMVKEPSVKCGITGTHISVMVYGEEEESQDEHAPLHHNEYNHHQVHNHLEHNHQDHNHHEHQDHNHHDHQDHDHHDHQDHDHHQHQDHDHHHNDEQLPHKEHGHDHRDGHSHNHSSLQDIEHIVRGHLTLPKKVQDDVMAVYALIAEAESHAHGIPVTQIHFHEVGSMDAIADITAVCLLMDRLSPDEVVVSPIHVGSGQVRCAHGILPVPAPATAYILKDVPIYGGSIRGELCTPTGAAILKHFATRFGSMPVMKIQSIGYGMGKKDFEAANCVRALLGESEDKVDIVSELSCNVDDMTAESIGFAMERLFDGGALDVYTIPIGMKKSRPATLIGVMCSEKNKQKMIELLFRYTTTIGVREMKVQRYVLDRRIATLETPYGVVHRKDCTGYGVSRSKYEYEDITRIAKEQGLNMEETYELIENTKK